MKVVPGKVDFSKGIRDWDGFGFNYVECAQSFDYEKDPQDYGAFSIMSQEDRDRILDMVFGEDGLKPGTFKMFYDPWHQKEGDLNGPDPGDIDQSNYDHETTTQWMRYFAKEGLKRTRARGGDLEMITTLYGPPGWMTKQKVMRGRDLDPKFKLELAKYLVSWAEYLAKNEGLPVKWISVHNEGESHLRWNEEGITDTPAHDYNMFWPPELVAEYMTLLRQVLDARGLKEMAPTPGETTNWFRFSAWGYADAIADDPQAIKNTGLITSHGFWGAGLGRWYGPHSSEGIDTLRAKRPDLHAWVTSTSWSKMDSRFVFEIFDNIYTAKVNSIIPWAGIQRHSLWVGGDPNPGTAFKIGDDGSVSIEKGYYYYKQVCRAGQPGMKVAQAHALDSSTPFIAFASNGTGNPDALIVINVDGETRHVGPDILGTDAKKFEAYRTSPTEDHVSLGEVSLEAGKLNYAAPADSVTTFYAKS